MRLDKGSIILFDFETTGLLKPDGNLIDQQPKSIELCAIKTNQSLQIIDKFESLINPEIPISEEITNITNITNEMVQDKPTFIELYDDLFEFFFGCTTLIGHNQSFDKNILRYELTRHDLQFNWPWPKNDICTVEASHIIEGKRLKLNNLYYMATGGYIIDGHRASSDTLALIDCYKFLLKMDSV